MIYKLPTLHNYHLCCSLTGTFALFVTGKLDSFDGIAIFVAMTDPKTAPILCWLLQHLSATPPQAFAIDAFAFTLTNAHDAHMNMFHYAMSYENVLLPVTFVGSILSSNAAPSQTSIWSTLCGRISFASVTRNMLWSSHIEALMHSPDYCS